METLTILRFALPFNEKLQLRRQVFVPKADQAMNLFGIAKPEYAYRPRQLIKRLFGAEQHGHQTARLPWGATIRVSVDDNVGGQIATLGLYDLVVTETLWRLCESGATVIDIGANVGYTSFVMAHRIGNGKLMAFEPHPSLSAELRDNIASLKSQGCRSQIETHEIALGSVAGELPLHVPKDFSYHRGESSLAAPKHLEYSSDVISVNVKKLDDVITAEERIGVMKIDVEGFELDVLRGAEKLFSERRVRDVVFEEHNAYPTPVTKWFETHGYKLFRLDRSFTGLVVLPGDSTRPRTKWTPTNYVATSDPNRLKNKLGQRGWACLKG